MEYLSLVILISFTAGFLWGRHTTKIAFTRAFKGFTDEVHKQYLACLKSKGINTRYDQKSSERSKVYQN